MVNNQKLVLFLLRLSIASVFLYAAVAATVQPYNWIGFIPQFAQKIAPANILLMGFSAFQVILGVWIISGWKAFYSAAVSALTLIAIITVNWGDIDILFRDFAIFFAACALAASSFRKK